MPGCKTCGAENDDAAEVCFSCRAVLNAITRGTLIGARYRVEALLGRGGMGAVYRAKDEVLDEEVALKILRPEVAGTKEMAARFRSEIKLARKVSHWNVCRIHEYGEEGALQFISMELISGANLKDRLRGGPLPADEAFDIAVQVADGLGAVHKVGIIHRDLKSPNVMIDAAGTAKVMDFGIAKPAAPGTDPGGSSSYVLGSPEYMSPEQARGRPADFRSDLYSLGIVVFEAFTGHVPFRGETPVATLMMHVEAPPPLDDPRLALPAPLLPVLRKALAKDPAHRFPDAAAVAAALREAREATRAGLAGKDAIAPTRRQPLPARRRRAASMAVVAAGVVAVCVAAALGLRDRGTTATTPPAPSRSPVLLAPSVSPSTEAPATPVTTSSPTVRPATPAVPSTRASAIAGGAAPPPMVSAPAPAPTEPAAAPVTEPRPPEATTPASATPSPAAPTPASPREGWLLVVVAPWADVSIDGRPAGQTPLARLSLSPGPHAIVLTNPLYQPFARKVTIRPGETTRIAVDLAVDGVRRRP